jgi:hypothetical protein
VRSVDPDATTSPDGENATQRTGPCREFSGIMLCSRVSALFTHTHSLSLPLSLSLSLSLPLLTLCPMNRKALVPGLKFHTITVLSSEPVASCLMFGLKSQLCVAAGREGMQVVICQLMVCLEQLPRVFRSSRKCASQAKRTTSKSRHGSGCKRMFGLSRATVADSDRNHMHARECLATRLRIDLGVCKQGLGPHRTSLLRLALSTLTCIRSHAVHNRMALPE